MDYNKIYNLNYKRLMDKIEDESVDLVLTDIPYLISRDTRFKVIKNHTKVKGKTKYIGMKYKFDTWTISDLDEYIEQCYRILKPGGNIIVWSSWQLLGRIHKILERSYRDDKHSNKKKRRIQKVRLGVWIKTDPAPFNIKIMPVNALEVFIACAKGENATFNRIDFKHRLIKGIVNIEDGVINETKFKNEIMLLNEGFITPNSGYERLMYMYPKKVTNEVNIHPTQKPLEIIKHLITVYSNENDIVYDGLMGSGVTAQASKLTQRRYIGTEINQHYYEKSIIRIENTEI